MFMSSIIKNIFLNLSIMEMFFMVFVSVFYVYVYAGQTSAYFEYRPSSGRWPRLISNIALCYNQGLRGYLSDEMSFN
jgi:hypothetical protein